MMAKKKKKKKKKNSPKKDYLTYQLYSPFSEEKTFPWGKVVLFLFLAFIIIGILTGDGSKVDECQKGLFNLLPCHCYSPNDPNIPSACY